MIKVLSLCAVLGLSFAVSATGESDAIYQLIEQRCESGARDPRKGLVLGTKFTRDFFYRDSASINQALDDAGWEAVDLEYEVDGEPESICDNGNQPTYLILTVIRVR